MTHQQESLTLEHDGVCVIPGVLAPNVAQSLRADLLESADIYRTNGGHTYMPVLDPNDRNIRVFNLLQTHASFRELIEHPSAVNYVEQLLGKHFQISNLTANIALPGSGSMPVHSDQALVVPEPWHAPWSINIMWCLDDVHADNGGTRFLRGSHHIATASQLPSDPLADMEALEAPLGSIVVMDGRIWHTSGENRTKNEERALLFAYYTADFLRPQVNWNVVLSADVQQSLTGTLSERLGLGAAANFRQGSKWIN